MPMTTLEQDTLAKACAVCKQFVFDLQPKLANLKQLYDSAGGVKATLTQQDLDDLVTLSGLTKQQVDDALYAMTAAILPAIDDGYAALSQLAARFL